MGPKVKHLNRGVYTGLLRTSGDQPLEMQIYLVLVDCFIMRVWNLLKKRFVWFPKDLGIVTLLA